MAKVSVPAPNQPSIIQSSQQKRLARNNDPIMKVSASEVMKKWNRADDEINKYHRNSCSCNVKYLSPDGHYEIVINTLTDTIVTDPRDVGTYNYVAVPAHTPKSANPVKWAKWGGLMIGHATVDVLPYNLFGNSENDFSSLGDRIIGN